MNTAIRFTEDGHETITIHMTNRQASVTKGGSGTYIVSGDWLSQQITTVAAGNTATPIRASKPQVQTHMFSLAGDPLTLIDPINRQTVMLMRVKE